MQQTCQPKDARIYLQRGVSGTASRSLSLVEDHRIVSTWIGGSTSRVVSKLRGHSSIAITADVYAHRGGGRPGSGPWRVPQN